MLTPNSAWTVRGATFGLWALAAGSAVYWGLHFSGGERPLALPPPVARQVAQVDPMALARLLGSVPTGMAAAAPLPTLASRFQLTGVAAGVESGGGAAVISVDGKPPRPYRVGASLDEGVVLKSVHGRQATIADASGQTLVVLEVPPLAAPVNAPNPGMSLNAPAAGRSPSATPQSTPFVSPRQAMPSNAPVQSPIAAPR